jgi:hypothetical protein
MWHEHVLLPFFKHLEGDSAAGPPACGCIGKKHSSKAGSVGVA